MSTETFRKSWWRGTVRSSHGFSVRVAGRTGIEYEDESGPLRIDSEVMARPAKEVVVYTGSIPEDTERSRSTVLDRVDRALAFAGWTVVREDAWIGGTK